MRDRVREAAAPPRRRAMLKPETKAQMMACVIRNPNVLTAVQATLTVEHVRDFIDVGIAVVYRLVSEFSKEYNDLPSRELLLADLESAMAEDPDLLHTEEIKQLKLFIKEAYRPEIEIATSESHAAWAIKHVKRFLDEVLADEVRQTLGDDDMVIADIPDVLATMRGRADAIAGLTHSSVAVPFPEGWEESPNITVTPLGLTFFDLPMDGGMGGGEVNLLMGPYGSCKTTLTVMGCTLRAQREFARTQEPNWDGRNGLVFLVSYEASTVELRTRLLSYAATIHRDSLKGDWKMQQLSTRATLKEYEIRRYAADLAADRPVRGERDRMRAQLPVLNKHLRIIDMSGADVSRRSAGGGYVSEISREISAVLQRERDAYPALVWIDYAGACAERYIDSMNWNHNELRHLLKGMPLLLRNQIAAQYDCTVMLNHQLSAEANSRHPGAPMHHTDAAESKAMAENVDFAGCLSTVTGDGLATIHWTKHRRHYQLAPVTLRIVGEFGRVDDVSAFFRYDDTQRKFVSAADAQRTEDSKSTAAKAKAQSEGQAEAVEPAPKAANPVAAVAGWV